MFVYQLSSNAPPRDGSGCDLTNIIDFWAFPTFSPELLGAITETGRGGGGGEGGGGGGVFHSRLGSYPVLPDHD